MSVLNRARLLWGYWRGQSFMRALPVEYVVETTAKCNLYCPMCPRETHPQPKEDMPGAIFDRLVEEAGPTAEHMMLIGLGEPFLDPKIFDRIEHCHTHGIHTLLSTNGTLLNEERSRKLLDSPLAHITLSFDGASRESYEYYRKGARFEQVRDNFVRFARMKHERQSPVQVVVQMVRMERNQHETEEFIQFWKQVPGVDQVRVKADETDLMQPAAPRTAGSRRCHYLWRGPMYVKHNGDVYPCCQSYMLDGKPVGNLRTQDLPAIFNSPEMRDLRKRHAEGRSSEIDMCVRCRSPLPHPLLVTGSLLLDGRTVRRLLPLMERLAYWSGLPLRLLRPARPPERFPTGAGPLVQIERPEATAASITGSGRE